MYNTAELGHHSDSFDQYSAHWFGHANLGVIGRPPLEKCARNQTPGVRRAHGQVHGEEPPSNMLPLWDLGNIQ